MYRPVPPSATWDPAQAGIGRPSPFADGFPPGRAPAWHRPPEAGTETTSPGVDHPLHRRSYATRHSQQDYDGPRGRRAWPEVFLCTSERATMVQCACTVFLFAKYSFQKKKEPNKLCRTSECRASRVTGALVSMRASSSLWERAAAALTLSRLSILRESHFVT